MSDQDVDWDSDEPIVESLMNRIAVLEARIREWESAWGDVSAELAEWERLGVKVWEDCPRCKGRKALGEFEHVDPYTGDHLGNELIPCPDCDGSGKVPAEGVQQAANGWWIAPDRMERR